MRGGVTHPERREQIVGGRSAKLVKLGEGERAISVTVEGVGEEGLQPGVARRRGGRRQEQQRCGEQHNGARRAQQPDRRSFLRVRIIIRSKPRHNVTLASRVTLRRHTTPGAVALDVLPCTPISWFIR